MNNIYFYNINEIFITILLGLCFCNCIFFKFSNTSLSNCLQSYIHIFLQSNMLVTNVRTGTRIRVTSWKVPQHNRRCRYTPEPRLLLQLLSCLPISKLKNKIFRCEVCEVSTMLDKMYFSRLANFNV